MGGEVPSCTPNHQFPTPEEVCRHAHNESQVSPPTGSGSWAPCADGQPQSGKDKGSHASAAPHLRSRGYGPTGQSNLQMVAGQPTPKALGWARTSREPKVVVGGIFDSVLHCAQSCRKCSGALGPDDHHARGPQKELAVVKAGSSSSSVKFPGSVSLSSLHISLFPDQVSL